MIKSNKKSLSNQLKIDYDLSLMKQNLNQITEIYLETGKKYLKILNKMGTTKFNKWLRLEFPQQLLTIRKQVLVAQFAANHRNHQDLIKEFDIEFLCILAKAPNSVSQKILKSNHTNWSIAQLKELIKQHREQIQNQKKLNKTKKTTNNQTIINQRLRKTNQQLKRKHQEAQKNILDLTQTLDQLKQENQTLCENNIILQTLIHNISTAATRHQPNTTPSPKFDPYNMGLFRENYLITHII